MSSTMSAVDDKAPTKDGVGVLSKQDIEQQPDHISVDKGDVLGTEHVDPVLDAKIRLVNDTIDEIGMTGYQWKLFVLNGFG